MSIADEPRTERLLDELARIPYDLLPAGSARVALYLLVRNRGCEMNIYPQIIGYNDKMPIWSWVIWLQPQDPREYGRHFLEEWCKDWYGLSITALEQVRRQKVSIA